MRHLTPAFAIGALRRGKPIEQFLGGFQQEGRPALRWSTISPTKSSLTVSLHEVEDVGPDALGGTYDISEYPPLDEEEYLGEGRDIGICESPEQALDLAERELRARKDRWVNFGVLGDEYADYRAARNGGSPPNP
ncbi:hypothetical protein [Actinomadura sp. 6N118]|uniref:hypothetical protein n=1 Tax=Actinomadura sp. 6N118 TaxID=3375151 RepID=UPI0037A09E16